MRDLLMLSLALIPLLVAGCGIALLVLPRERPIVPGELLGVGYLAGGAFVSLLSFYCGLLVGGRVVQLVVLAACAAVAAAGLARRPWPTWNSGTPGGTLLTAVPLVLALVVGWLSLRLPMAWDGVMTWEAKARLIWLGGGRLPLEVLSQPYRVHADYPLMVPALEAWVYGWLGHVDQALAKVLFTGFFLAASWLLSTAALRLGLATAWALAAAVLPVCVPTLLVGEGSATSGYADFPLAACYLGSVVYLLEYLRERRRDALRAAGVLAAILPWIKVEGAILWGCVAAFAALIALRRRQLSALAWVIVPGLMLLAGWRILLLASDAHYGRFLAVRPGTLLGNLPRLGLVGQALWRYTTGGEWSLFWPVAALSTVVAPWTVRPARPAAGLLAAAVALPAALYSAVYLFTPVDPAFHIATSLPRLLIQVSLPAVLLILLPALAWTRRGDPEPRPLE